MHIELRRAVRNFIAHVFGCLLVDQDEREALLQLDACKAKYAQAQEVLQGLTSGTCET